KRGDRSVAQEFASSDSSHGSSYCRLRRVPLATGADRQPACSREQPCVRRPLPLLGVLGEDTLRMRVWPNDIDLNLHMNNARYLSIMDYARTHYLARTRLLEHIIRSRWQPLVGAAWL